MAAQLSEKTTALQQVEYLSQQLQQQCQAVLGLEGARDQLEQDKFNIQSSLSEMEGKRDQVGWSGIVQYMYGTCKVYTCKCTNYDLLYVGMSHGNERMLLGLV